MTALAPFSRPGRFWRGNLHTHSTLSDGALTPRDVVEAYKNAGYDFMMLSDHFIGHFGGWVQVKAESLDPDVLLAALKRGEYYSSQGPVIHDVALEGTELNISCSPVDTIVAICGNSRSAGRSGKSITGATVDLKKFEDGWLLRSKSPWFRVSIIDQAGKRAWTNPIWWDELR